MSLQHIVRRGFDIGPRLIGINMFGNIIQTKAVGAGTLSKIGLGRPTCQPMGTFRTTASMVGTRRLFLNSRGNTYQTVAIGKLGWTSKSVSTNYRRLFADVKNSAVISRRLASNGAIKPQSSTVFRWLKYSAGVILASVFAIFAYSKYRVKMLEKKGFIPFDIPHFRAQIIAPFGFYKGIAMSSTMIHSVDKANVFPVREDDVFVISFPRSGTTWTQEIVYLIGNEVDREKACSQNLESRFPYLEDAECQQKNLSSMTSPRFIKTHLPYRLLPKEIESKRPKIIYIMRNPKDVIVSFFHLWQKIKGSYLGKFEDFCELFLQDKMMFCPWLDHIQDYWNRRDQDNILFIRYEDLKQNLPREVEKISKFLDKPLTKEQLHSIVDHCSFESMKNNSSVNYNWWDDRGLTTNIGTSFIRKGHVGDWKNHFTPELNLRMSEKLDKRLDQMGIEVKYEVD